jgi:hypothetical protein
MFIHHDTICAERASEDSTSGCYDVIEQSDGFKVFNRGAGMWEQIGPFETLDEATLFAEQAADKWDAAQQRVAP